MTEDLPREDLDVLLNVARLRVGEAHNDFEELFAVGFALGDSLRVESLEVAADAVLLFDGEAHCDQLL